MKKNRSKPIIAEIVGGLGNQIFTYAAALEQSKRLGVDVQVDISWFSRKVEREFQLQKLFPIEKAKSGALRHYTRVWSEKLKLNRSKARILIEQSNAYDPRVTSITPGTRLRGYFQSTKYFPNVGHEIASAISNAALSAHEQQVIDRLSSSNFNAIHVRRGDYASDPVTKNHHGLTTRGYFEEGLRLLGDNALPVLVFSDSIELVRIEMAGTPNFWLEEDLEGLSDIATLKLLSRAQNLIISNSSFSWWAAYTIHLRNPLATIVAPKPWSKEIDANSELILPSWSLVAL